MTSKKCCEPGCLQLTLLIVNILILFCATSLFGTGAYYLSGFSLLELDLNHPIIITNILMITCGCILIIMIVVTMTTSHTNTIVLMLYTVIMFLVFVLQAILCGYCDYHAYRPNQEWLGTTQRLDRYVREYYVNGHYRTIMDRVQSKLQCCGSSGWQDYSPNNPTNLIPSSCFNAFGELYHMGCNYRVNVMKYTNVPLFFGFGGASMALQLFGAVLAIVLTCRLQKTSDIV